MNLNNSVGRQLFKFLFLAIFILFLSSCAHLKRGDGPPQFYVDETKIPNAVPKPEPLAKYGNIKSYVVFGKRYRTLKSSKNYEEIGTASWYGTQFHAHKTSSGEPYNMLGMTAAHKTLPLPTYVEVTNLKNNKRIIVKVNDRGPFASSRIIDLSYVAAKKLGMLGHGTAHVRVKAIDTSKPVFMPSQTNHYFAQNRSALFLQVGAFRDKSHAQKLQQQLSAFVATPIKIFNPSEHGNLYRVKIGPFRDLAAANEITAQLRNMGLKPNKTNGDA